MNKVSVKEKIGIIGTGNIGAGNATLSVGNGFETVIVAYSEEERDRGRSIIESNFAGLKAMGKVSDRNIEAAMKLLRFTYDYAELSEADFVFETVFEDVGVKKEVYEKIEAVVGNDAIIASSTSSLTAAELSMYVRHKERFVVAHPFQPTHLQPLVELSICVDTSEESLNKAKAILEKLKREVVVIKKELPGFIGNRLAQAMFRESLYMIEEGVAEVADIDKAIKYVIGKRYSSIGLMEYYDAVGFELERDIAQNVYPTLCSVTEIHGIVKIGLASGDTGLSAGQGLYDWREKDVDDFRARQASPFGEMFDWDLPS
jgi:3-hydroxybutyryl-CoA dehydrogenase